MRYLLLLGLSLAVGLAVMSCGADEDDATPTATGSCSAEITYGGDTSDPDAPTIKMCANYNGVAQKSDNDAKESCEKADADGPVSDAGTWSEDMCTETGVTAKCTGSTVEQGGTLDYFTYTADFNTSLKSICADDDGTYEELVAAATYKASLESSPGGTMTQCAVYSEMSEMTRDAMKQQFSQMQGVTWTDDGTCTQTGVVASCVGAQNSGGFSQSVYYYAAPGSSAETECTGDGGTWSEN